MRETINAWTLDTPNQPAPLPTPNQNQFVSPAPLPIPLPNPGETATKTTAPIPQPTGNLLALINRDFGSFDNFKNAFTAAAMGVFGSGYAWLVLDRNGKLQIITTPDQETPLTVPSLARQETPLAMPSLTRHETPITAPGTPCPLLNIDVWEHAYYLKHYNLRADYLANFWYIVNWGRVAERLEECLENQNRSAK